MATPPLEDRLAHIVDAIRRIETIWRGKSFEDYKCEPVLVAATERYLEKICEAVKHIPKDEKSLHPQIPWVEIRGLGNRLRHGYETIDDALVWDVVTKDLAALKTAIERIRAGLRGPRR